MESTNLFGAAKPVIDRPLIAYAFLAQTNPGNGDLLFGLAPIFKPLAREWAGRRFDAEEFARRAEDLYQIRIHPWAADDLAPRLEKAGLLVKTAETRYAVSYTYAAIEDEFTEIEEADIRLVVKKFIDYARPLCSRHRLDLSDSQLEGEFFKQLVSMDFHAALLKPKHPTDNGKLRLPATVAASNSDEDANLDPKKIGISILCAGFIMSMHHEDPAAYDLILRIATGAMVAEAVLNIQSPGGDVNFNQLRIVLDSPFLMALLDLDEVTKRVYAKTLCDQLTNRGATLQVFRHSIDEISEAIDATIQAVQHGEGKGALARRLGMRTYRQYVNSIRADLEGELRRQHITPINVPTAKDAFTFFSEDDEGAICGELGHYENTLARERDAASVAAIMRQRRNRRVPMSQVHFAQYIFLTSNPRVADAANRYTVRTNLRAPGDVPPVFTDRYMASLLFVMFGGQGKEITHYQLLANCSAALEPHSDIMGAMYRFLNQLDPVRADHFRAIMTDDRASQHLMQLTLGEVCITSTQDAASVLEALEQRYDDDARRRYEKQLEEVQAAGTDALARQAAEHERAMRVAREEYEHLQEQVSADRQARVQDRLDLDSAKRNTELLAQQMASLEASRQEDILHRLSEAAEYGHRRGELRHRELTFLLVLIVLICTLAGAGLMEDNYKIWALSGALGVSIASGFAFYKNPQRLLASHIQRVAQGAFERRALELHVGTDLQEFVVDLEQGTVSRTAPPPT